MTDKIKIKVYCTTGFAGCDHVDYFELDREEWQALTEEEQREELDNFASTFMGNYIDYGAYVVEDEDE